MRYLLGLAAAVAVSVGLAACSTDAAQKALISPTYDNILYEDSQGSVSNGAGQTIHVGANGRGQKRRGVIAFKVEDRLSLGARITGVRLTLNLSRASSEDTETVSFHKLLTFWGEGASDAEGNEGGGADAMRQDATWLHAAHDGSSGGSLWTTPGGDFVAEPSASLSVGDLGQYTWTSEQMVADVQSWIDDPSTNFGWLLKGNEAGMGTVKRFDSRDNPDHAVRPVLEIEFE